MRVKSVIVASILAVGSASAQDLKLDILSPSIRVLQDSAVISMKMAISVPEMDSKSYIRLTPILTNSIRSTELPFIILNGEKAQKLYRRNQALNKRKGKKEAPGTFAVIGLTPEEHKLDYRTALATEGWMRNAKLLMRKEVINGNGDKTQNETFSFSNNKMIVFTQETGQVSESYPLPKKDVVLPANPPVSAGEKHFKGSYISPESDATDERNQKELNFSLEEARVMAGVNPQILSLRELYTVAISYKNDPFQFYKIIDTSVKIYPASPVANLNAAAAAIEQGNIEAAGRYLQMASHESLAYKNCRGVYELLCNNTYEGIRLLKSAKAAGSEEAAQNLKLFFESNKTVIE